MNVFSIASYPKRFSCVGTLVMTLLVAYSAFSPSMLENRGLNIRTVNLMSGGVDDFFSLRSAFCYFSGSVTANSATPTNSINNGTSHINLHDHNTSQLFSKLYKKTCNTHHGKKQRGQPRRRHNSPKNP